MPKPRIQFDVHGISDLGLKRSTNQDHFAVVELRTRARILQGNLEDNRKGITGRAQGRLLVVADGMGGMADGGTASLMAVRAFVRAAANGAIWAKSGDDPTIGKRLSAAATRCRKALLAHAAGMGATRSMGTTLTCACAIGQAMTLLHVGDSRCYRLRKGKLARLTTDHTMAQRLAEEGALNAAQAAASPFAHVLWNSISSAPSSELKPQLVIEPLQPRDVLLLCTDGLTKHLDDKRIAQVLKEKTDARARAEKLVAEARDKGGTDNITVIVAQLQSA